jgi:protein-S-isoprenylcysteine O-methyltransferase Ste14
VPSRFRVVAGYLAGLVVFAFAGPTPRSILAAVPFFVLGEAVRLWASGHIEKTLRLATGGPYAHTRNPLYVGSALLAAGVAVACASLWAAAAVTLYLAAFYPAVIREETAFLRRKFEGAYETWASAVPVFVPRLTPGGPRETRFSWARVAQNREWRTAAALPFVLALLVARRYLPI